jgi:hypothetical protein
MSLKMPWSLMLTVEKLPKCVFSRNIFLFSYELLGGNFAIKNDLIKIQQLIKIVQGKLLSFLFGENLLMLELSYIIFI